MFQLNQGLAVAWSLTIEVAFYVILPFLAIFLGWLGRNRDARTRMRRQVYALLVLGLTAEGFRLAVFVLDHRYLNFTLASMFLPFAIGMLFAVSSAWVGVDERRWRWTAFVVDRPGACWMAAVAIFVACCLSPIFARTGAENHTLLTWAFEQLAYVVVSALLLLPAIFGETSHGWPRRILANRLLGFVGAISYGIFLWHLPILHWMSKAGWGRLIPGHPGISLSILCLAASILLGWASYRLIELPMMKRRGQTPKRLA